MTIGKKIATGFGLALAILVIIGSVAWWSTTKLIDTNYWVAHTHEVVTNLESLLSIMKDAETGQRGFLLTEDEKYLEPYQKALINRDLSVRSLRQLTSDNPAQQRRLDALEPLIQEKFDELQETITLRKQQAGAKGLEAALAVVKTDRGKKIMDNIRVVIEEIKKDESSLLADREKDTKTSTRLSFLTIGLGTALALLVMSVAGFLITRSVTNPVRSAVNGLTAAGAELLATTAQLAAGAQEQAAAVSETVTTVDEVTQTSDQAAQRARGVGEAIQRTMQIGKAGRQVVEESIAALGVVKERVESTAEDILGLAEQAQAIGDIIATVNDIAEQTNLLALNAAIEASRAGEHGRGFAVVAGEVKALADQSKKATSQVRQILGDVQKATNTAVLSTEEVTKGVASATKVAAQAGETIQALSATLEETAQAAVQIVGSANQQAVGMTQIHKAMMNIDQVAKQNLVAMRQAEQAAKNLNEVGARLATLAIE